MPDISDSHCCDTADSTCSHVFFSSQCCVAVMIYSGPVPTLKKFRFRFCLRFRFWIQTVFSRVLKNVQNLAFQCQKQHHFLESWPLILDFRLFLFHFTICCIRIQNTVGSGTGTGILMHSGSGSTLAKSYGSCGSGSTTLPRALFVVLQDLLLFRAQANWVSRTGRPFLL
jgi:hypothetical protein